MGDLIAGVTLTAENIISNEKGDISHALKSCSEGFRGFGEAYFSRVQKQAIKGWKRHNEVHLNLVVPLGSILVAVHDGRPESDTYGQTSVVRLGYPDDYSRLTVVPGLWVAFKGEQEMNLILNITEQELRPDEADNIELDQIKLPPEFLAGIS